jgi:hypothetical protein
MHKAFPRLCRLFATLALPAGCAPGRPPAPPAVAAAAPDAGQAEPYGVIVAARRLPPGGGAAGDMRATVLAALGTGAAAAGPAAALPALEFIVRDTAGRTVSVVQDNPQQLRPGDRVAIRRAGRTELVRAADGPAIAAAGG